jgi:glucose/arabinose dehydrogenase
MKKWLPILAILLLAIVFGANFYWRNLRGIAPAIRPPSGDITELTLPPGFSFSLVTDKVSGARVMAMDGFGNLWISRTSEGIVSLVEMENGRAKNVSDIFRVLNRPHGLAIDPQDPFILYIAETDKISKVRIYSEGELRKIADLPGGGGHFTRTIGFGPDGRLYVSIGSSCNVCNEADDRRAKIFVMEKDGSNFQEYARGLRNSVFFTWSYVDGRMWATEMGRDLLGDDLPPDEINIIEESKNYGWPICYGKNIHDTEFDKNTYIRNPCMEPFEIPSYIDIPAHSAPLGLAFVPEEGWPEEYWYDLLVAYHGSWNRSEPTGYKVVRMKLDARGNYSGTEDFIAGWLKNDNSVIGRPVDILVQPGGVMYLSDDKAGAIYRIAYKGEGRISTFEDCVGAGGIILESYPRQCRAEGKSFTENIGNELEKLDLIRISSPRPNQIISSPLLIEGEARGYWFFEASFPVRLYNANGEELAVIPIQAQNEWMTTDFVPFRAMLEFGKPGTETGTLVLEKDNPSGLPEHADELRVPVRFR